MKKLIKLLKGFLKSIGIILIFCIYLSLIIGSVLYLINKDKIDSIQKDVSSKLSNIDKNTFKRSGPTIIYDKNSKEIGRFATGEYIYTNYEDIPELMRYAFIATEDQDFYENVGISFKGMTRAFFVSIKNKGEISQGGSTITQQVVKNIFLTQERTLQRKYAEVMISLNLAKMYTKDQILEFYINNINFSNGAYSAASAAKVYFNKPLKELNLAEVAFLAAIPNNPTYYNPLKNYNNVVVRQHLMLKNLKDQLYITDEQYNEAINTKVTINYTPYKNQPESYLLSYAMDCATRTFMKRNGFMPRYEFSSNEDKKRYDNEYKVKYEEFDRKLRAGGYAIYTSLDLEKQDILQSSLDEGLGSFSNVDSKSGLYSMQGAATCIDNSNGEVIAIVGGRSQKDKPNSYNRAFLAARQPGSAIKPLLVYAPAFDKGYSPYDIIMDKEIPNGPKNSGNAYFGPVPIRYAVEMSLNTVAYQLFMEEGIDYGLAYLHKMNYSHIVPQDRIPVASLGGFTYGATTVEMASAYATLARGGTFIEPSCIRKITTETGDPFFENLYSPTNVYSKEASYNMTDVLKGVTTKPYATGYGLGLNNMPAACKTGTTSESKDGWFAGYTPYMTTVVWVGYDTPIAVEDLYGATYPGHIWQSFMNKTHEGLPYKDFEMPQQ